MQVSGNPSREMMLTDPIDGPARLRRLFYLLTITVAAGVTAAAVWNATPLQSANDRSRWTTVWSLAERGTYRIDEIVQYPGWDTIDKVRHEGHFYSSKPPLLATITAGVYWCIKHTLGWTLGQHTRETTRLILLILNWLPMVIALVVTAAVVERYARTTFGRMTVVCAAAFGTLLTPFLTTLNNHTVAATSAVFAIYPLLRIISDRVEKPWLFALCGFWAAFTCCNELPAALFGVLAFVLLAWRSPWKTALYFVPAALVPLVAYFWTNYLATGGFKPFYAFYGTEKYLYTVDGIPSYWLNPQGVDKNLDSPGMYLLHSTLGHHGILSLTPLFFLVLVTWCRPRLWRNEKLSPVIWLSLGLTVVVLLFYLSRTENYNYGGVSAGLRWSFWLIPFWLMSLIPTLDRWADCRWFRGGTAALLAVSVFSAWLPIQNPWQQPWLFKLMEQAGWINYADVAPPLPHPLWTWFPSLPPNATEDEPIWLEFAGPDLDGGETRVRLTARGQEQFGGRMLQVVDVTRGTGETATTERLYLDAAALEAGRHTAEILYWPLSRPTPGQQRADLTFIRGLPRLIAYQGGQVRYLKVPLRREAFRCQRAAARVLHQPERSPRTLQYRCDVWLTEDVPFGVVQVEYTVSDPLTGQVFSRQQLSAVATNADVRPPNP